MSFFALLLLFFWWHMNLTNKKLLYNTLRPHLIYIYIYIFGFSLKLKLLTMISKGNNGNYEIIIKHQELFS